MRTLLSADPDRNDPHSYLLSLSPAINAPLYPERFAIYDWRNGAGEDCGAYVSCEDLVLPHTLGPYGNGVEDDHQFRSAADAYSFIASGRANEARLHENAHLMEHRVRATIPVTVRPVSISGGGFFDILCFVKEYQSDSVLYFTGQHRGRTYLLPSTRANLLPLIGERAMRQCMKQETLLELDERPAYDAEWLSAHSPADNDALLAAARAHDRARKMLKRLAR